VPRRPGERMARRQRRLVCDAVGQLELVHELGVLVVFEPVAAIALALLLEEAVVCPRPGSVLKLRDQATQPGH
jgi:hypothetical protein